MKINAFRAIGEILVVLVAAIAGLQAAGAALGTLYASPLGMLAGVAAAIFLVKLRGEQLSDFGFRSASVVKTITVVIVIAVLSVVLFLFAEPVLERHFGPIDFSIFSPMEGEAGFLIFMLVVSWIGAAFGEEVVYRGFVTTRLAQIFSLSVFGWVFAILIQAALFALAHGYQGVTGMIEIFVIAIALGAAYVATGRSLVPVIIAHGLLDTFGMTDFYFGGALTEAIASLR